MKLTVLGIWAAYPKANDACSGYLLTAKGKNILLDCGSGVLSSLANYINFEDLDAVVLSHYHADHMSDIYPLQYAIDLLIRRGKRQEALLIYGHNDEAVFHTLNYKEACIAKPIKEGNDQNIGGVSFKFFKTKHQKTCHAMRVEVDEKVMVYTGDTGWMEELAEFARHTDLLICETSLFNQQKGLNEGHLTAGEAGRIAYISNAKELLITHFPHEGNIEELQHQAQEEFRGSPVLTAHKDMIITL